MKIFQMCVFVLMLMFASAMAFANGIDDPKVILHGAGGGSVAGPCPNCQGVGQNFSFTIPASGSGTLYFTNDSGKAWTSLTLVETGVPAADISCHSDLFSSCTTKTLKNGSVEILLSGANGHAQWADHGIQAGQSFAMQFSCVKGSCWDGGMTFGAHGGTGTVPEPGTVALMMTGIAALVSRRKSWKNRKNS
jgi:hypothetical protein